MPCLPDVEILRSGGRVANSVVMSREKSGSGPGLGNLAGGGLGKRNITGEMDEFASRGAQIPKIVVPHGGECSPYGVSVEQGTSVYAAEL